MTIISYSVNFVTNQIVATVDESGTVFVRQCFIGAGGLPEQFTVSDLKDYLEQHP